MHHHDAAGLAVVAGYPLGTVSGGRCRGSLIEADIHKEQSKVEPAGYRLKGELSISTLSCLSVLSEFQPTLTEWMVESYLPPIRGMPQLSDLPPFPFSLRSSLCFSFPISWNWAFCFHKSLSGKYMQQPYTYGCRLLNWALIPNLMVPSL